jgi:hypothetical protein
MAYRSPYRDSRSPNLFRLIRLSQLIERPMNGGNQIRKLIRPQPMVPNVASDYLGCQMWTDPFGIHENTSLISFDCHIQKLKAV